MNESTPTVQPDAERLTPDQAQSGAPQVRPYGCHGLTPAATPQRQDVQALIALSDERDAQLELRLNAYREGYLEGARGQFSAGYAAAIADVKRTWHEIAAAVGVACRRLTPGGDAWLHSVIRNGATEYGGEGKPRVPADPAAIVLAWKAQARKGASK